MSEANSLRRQQPVEIKPIQRGQGANNDNNNLKRRLANLEPTKEGGLGTEPAEKSGDRRFHLFLGNQENKENPDHPKNTTKPDGETNREALKDVTNTLYNNNLIQADQLAKITGTYSIPAESPPPTNAQQKMMSLGRLTEIGQQLNQRQEELALQLQLKETSKTKGDFFGLPPEERAKQEVKEQVRDSLAKQQQELKEKAVTPAQNVMLPPKDTDQATKKLDTDNPNSGSTANGLNSKLRDAETALRDQLGNETLEATVSELKTKLGNVRDSRQKGH